MFFREPRWFLWSGLLICALLKALLIFMYFMHMKFERWLVWSLVLPTPLLIAVIMLAVSPDGSYNGLRDHPNGAMLNDQGRVEIMQRTFHAHGQAASQPAAPGEAKPAAH
jgi:hypothetical protein